MTTAAYLDSASFRTNCAAPRWTARLWPGFLLCSLFSIVFLPEFAHDNLAGSTAWPLVKIVGGFRVIDLALLAAVFSVAILLGCSRDRQLIFPRELAWPGAAFLACIVVAAGYGRTRGGTNFFFDWRGLALGIGLYLVWSFFLQSRLELDFAIKLFILYAAIRIVLLYLLHFTGNGDTLFGVSIPTFDGPTISCVVFASLLAFQHLQNSAAARERLLWGGLAAAGALLVLLCLRRTYWIELGFGILILLLLRKRNRLRNLMFLGVVIAAAGALLGASLARRIQSFDLSNDDSEFSADNADHLHDLADAWEQVQLTPVMGIGLGTSYPTWHIRHWKQESVMVHNAVLHVWLKYGIAGLLCYLWFHVALLRWLYRGFKAEITRHRVFVGAAFAYLAAQFAMTLTFAPWPYSELQLTTLMSFILAVAVMSGVRPDSRPTHAYSKS
jgi:hypothetical protein